MIWTQDAKRVPQWVQIALLGLLSLIVWVACGAGPDPHASDGTGGHEASSEQETGSHGGALLRDGSFALELAMREEPEPELWAWATAAGETVAPVEVALRVELGRLGGRVDVIRFEPEGDALRGRPGIGEPHSFEVKVEATHAGESHTWRYESFEGRTRIAEELATRLGVETAVAGPAVLAHTVTLYGEVRADPARTRALRARFPGVVRGAHAEIGDSVAKGAPVLTIESDESLNRYTVDAPIAGVVTGREANPGEHTADRVLMTLTDVSSVWAELSVFPGNRGKVRVGQAVEVRRASGSDALRGEISNLEVVTRADQSIRARVVLRNPNDPSRRLLPGDYVTAVVVTGEDSVALAVERAALQSFRDFSVVYARFGEVYEVRMLELGREAGALVEVLAGIEPGTRYVAAGSFVIKADIEKSGATHDH